MKKFKYLFILLLGPLYGGEFRIDATVVANPEKYALVLEKNNTTITYFGNNFSLSPGSLASLTIRYLTLKPGQVWQKFTIKANSIGFRLQSAEGELILTDTINSGSKSYNIGDHKAAKEGKTLVLILLPTAIFNFVQEVVLTYTGSGSLLAYPNPWQVRGGPLRIDFDLESDAQVRLEIYDSSGRLVKSLRKGELYPAKLHSKESDFWDGRSDGGMALPSGIYYIRLQVRYLKSEFSSYEKSFRVVLVR